MKLLTTLAARWLNRARRETERQRIHAMTNRLARECGKPEPFA